jgi:hypothetical protein
MLLLPLLFLLGACSTSGIKYIKNEGASYNIELRCAYLSECHQKAKQICIKRTLNSTVEILYSDLDYTNFQTVIGFRCK